MHPFDRIAAVSLAIGLLLTQLAACGRAPEESANENHARDKGAGGGLAIQGAGSTFAAPLFKKWMESFGAAHPELRLSYDVVGSGEGIDRFLAGTVDIAATDAPLKPEQAAGVAAGTHQIPVTAGMIVLTYNLPGVESPLNLPRDVYPDIFLGRVSRWDDPRIAAANPGVRLPPKLIQVVARQDSSGTTFAFTNHLGAISQDWAKGPGIGKQIDWPGGAMVVRGNEGVAQRVKITEGSIGYVEYGFAERLHLRMAWLENRAGGLIAPLADTGSRALAGGSDTIPENLTVLIPDPEGARSYPIVTYSWALVYDMYPDSAKAEAIQAMLRWALTDGQAQAEAMGYIPLPENAAQAALAEVEMIGG